MFYHAMNNLHDTASTEFLADSQLSHDVSQHHDALFTIV